MLRVLAMVVSLTFTGACLGATYHKDVYTSRGEFVGVVWTDSDEWIQSDDELECADLEDCKDQTTPNVCMTYNNNALIPIVCRLEVSALLAEPFTGFTKLVTDVRNEVVFYNQTHNVCFNFSKDRYNLWVLIQTSEPKIECEGIKGKLEDVYYYLENPIVS